MAHPAGLKSFHEAESIIQVDSSEERPELNGSKPMADRIVNRCRNLGVSRYLPFAMFFTHPDIA
jgi:hypothetical protein